MMPVISILFCSFMKNKQELVPSTIGRERTKRNCWNIRVTPYITVRVGRITIRARIIKAPKQRNRNCRSTALLCSGEIEWMPTLGVGSKLLSLEGSCLIRPGSFMVVCFSTGEWGINTPLNLEKNLDRILLSFLLSFSLLKEKKDNKPMKRKNSMQAAISDFKTDCMVNTERCKVVNASPSGVGASCSCGTT